MIRALLCLLLLAPAPARAGALQELRTANESGGSTTFDGDVPRQTLSYTPGGGGPAPAAAAREGRRFRSIPKAPPIYAAEGQNNAEDAPPPKSDRAVLSAAVGGLAGAAIGFMVGGPIGAVIGLLAGIFLGAFAGSDWVWGPSKKAKAE